MPFEIAEFLYENDVGVFFKNEILYLLKPFSVLIESGEHLYIVRHYFNMTFALGVDIARSEVDNEAFSP